MGDMATMRISIVNNNKRTIELIKEILQTRPRYIVTWVAYGAEEALDKAIKESTDLILMGLDLKPFDGVKATGVIMREKPCAILILADGISKNAARIFEAMGCGALDAVAIPFVDNQGNIKGGEELLKKISTIEKLIKKEHIDVFDRDKFGINTLKPFFPMVAIGSSTGGPGALAEIISKLPKEVDAAIVIIQHVDVQFAGSLVEWLAGKTSLSVKIAEKGIVPEKGVVYIAGTNDHLIIDRDFSFKYTAEPKDNPYRPSVDEFFYSLINHWQGGGVAVLLTGMGRDGAKGLLKLKKAGWFTIVQDEKTSIVYGMPGAALNIGAACEVLPVEDIAEGIVKYLKRLREEE